MVCVTKELIIQNRLGLHARAAAQFVQLANQFSCEIFIEKNGEEVNGKSIMGILMLAAPKGTPITLRLDGDDAQDALSALQKLVDDKFGED
ncbi:MAG: HPr family phosphocarrier protein [Desulfuromonadaceae bacterium]|nr:HPr family phosphocarrier protein [Desulfuromonadaceae bacterium]